jgi:hypothetical protein
MGESLFQRKTGDKPATLSPYDLIEREIDHLKHRPSVRYGTKSKRRMSAWLLVLAACGLGWLYLMDPFEHAWYKYEAISSYLYLHNYGTGKDADELAAAGILQPEEVTLLNRRHGSYQDTYASPGTAAATAQAIIAYMHSVKQLHAGAYANLDPVGRLRYVLFIRPGLFLPTSWDCLDPAVND